MVEGRIESARGQAKEVIGKGIGNKEMAVKGTAKENIGKAQADGGDLKEAIRSAL
jgi:uncharacterized protein YjbJ (UPF0337 family)